MPWMRAKTTSVHNGSSFIKGDFGTELFSGFQAILVKAESCLMQDEPGARVHFSYKMSLEEPFGMLGIDRKNAGRGTVEPGGYPGIFEGQRWGGIQRPA